jgi:16S rRNA (uracil1498-N3)-methyltransferase
MHAEDHSLYFISGIVEDRAAFSDEECHHIVSVLRAGPDAVIRATDGQGHVYRCSLDSFDLKTREAAIVEIIEQPFVKPRLHAYVCLPEREPFEEVLTHLTALGISEITPVVSRYCQQQWWSTWNKYEERFHRKMTASVKQSMNVWLPKLNIPVSFSAVVQRSGASLLLVADSSGKPCRDILEHVQAADELSCIVGPPGGLAPGELESLASAGAQFVVLGRTRLRTELAAVVLCTTIMQLCFREQ